MDSSTHFASVSITPSKDFSWVFFADWFLTFAISIGIIFHFSRLLGVLVSSVLHIILWRNRKVRIDVQSIKLSFLGGRVFFKNLTIVTEDHTICALQGSLTWRYWIPNVRVSELELLKENSEANVILNSKLPCKFILEVEGFELFIYNRTLSYENIVNAFSEHLQDNKEFDRVFSQDSSDSTLHEETSNESISLPILKWVPLQIKVNKGAIVAGNKSTEAVLIVSFNSLDGLIDYGLSKNSLDICRLSQSADFEKLEVSLKPNILLGKNEAISEASTKRSKWRMIFRKKANVSSQETWKGLSHYLEADNESIPEKSQDDIEYAKYTSILSTDHCHIHYFYDIPGVVPVNVPPTNPLSGLDVGNGGTAPELGIAMQISETTIYYGPWAERQRQSLHQMIFPVLRKDSVAQKKLVPGQRRIYTDFSLQVEVLNPLIFRIPTREISKHENNQFVRPFGWVELKVGTDSLFSVQSGMVASNSGFDNKLNMTLLDLEVRTSVNHDILLKAHEHTMTADLGFPLKWNGHIVWTFLNDSRGVQTFFLREHITLLSDMFSDFASGPPVGYEMFRSSTYDLNWIISDYSIFLNINDANIVNNPLDFNDNCYLSFQGDELDIKVHVPLDAIIKKSSTIDYSISTPSFLLVLDTPPWHTLNNFLKRNTIGKSEEFKVEGSYTYHTELGLDLVDTIIIDCNLRYVALECYGFVVKYIMSIKENYFGDYINFKTLEEYTKSLGENTVESPNKRPENETDVHFSFCVDNGCIILPSHLYDSTTNLSLYFDSLDVDIRFTNYYMDLQADLSPIRGFHFLNSADSLDKFSIGLDGDPQLQIDGLHIHGHRMFGLPPIEPTYYCKWDIALGAVLFLGDSPALFALVTSITKLGFGYKNLENALLIPEPELFDTTTFTLLAPSISIELQDEAIESSIRLELSQLSFKFNDITNERYNNRVSVDLDELCLSVFDRATKHRCFELMTALKASNFCQKPNSKDFRQNQNDHIVLHDGPFHRVPFFLDQDLKDVYDQSWGSVVPSMSLPDGHPALTAETVDMLFDDMGGDKVFGEFNEDFFQDLGPDEIALHKIRRTKLYKSTIFGVDIKPVNNYENDEFKPLSPNQSEIEIDNLVLNFGNIDIRSTSDSVDVVYFYVEKYMKNSLKMVLDDLHLSVCSNLFKKLELKPSDLNIRMVIPSVNFDLKNEKWLVESEKDTTFNMVVENLSLALSSKEFGEGKTEYTLALHIFSFSVELQNSLLRPLLKIRLRDLEVWSVSNEVKTNSISLDDSDISVIDPEALGSYISSAFKTVSKLKEKFLLLQSNVQKTRIELIYQIAMASKSYKVEHDPAVITRPAYIIRLSKGHFRADDSWKVIVRLHHIFEHLPESWKLLSEKGYQSAIFSAPNTALDDVLKIFSRWRSWEFHDISNSWIFRYVFKVQDDSSSKIEDASELFVDNFSVNFGSERNNNVSMKGFELSLLKRFDSNIVKESLLLSFNIQSIVAHVTPGLLDLLLAESLDISSDKRTTTIIEPFSLKDTQIAIAIGLLDITASMSSISMSLYTRNVNLIGLLEEDELGKTNFSSTGKIVHSIFEINHRSLPLLSHRSHTIDFSFNKAESYLIFMSSKSIVIKMDQTPELYEDFLKVLSSDIQVLKQRFNAKTLSSQSSKTVSPGIFDTIHAADLKIEISNLEWSFNCFSPLKAEGLVHAIGVDIAVVNRFLYVESKCGKSSLDIFSTHLKDQNSNHNIFKSTHSGGLAFVICDIDNKNVSTKVDLGKNYLLLPDFLERFEQIQSSLKDSYSVLIRYSALIKHLSNTLKMSNLSPIVDKVDKSPSLLISKLQIVADDFSLGVELRSLEYKIQLKNICIDYFDMSLGASALKPYGQLSVSSAVFNIEGDQIEKPSSSLLDFQFGLKIINNPGFSDQTYQIESSYSRILLTTKSITRMMQLILDIKHMVSQSSLSAKSVSEPKFPAGPGFKYQSIHVLAYNICAGLVFADPTTRSPGVIIGCEKVFAIAEESFGKLSLVNAYLSIAKGGTSVSFYSLGNEFENPNRAFLPNMQISYAIRKLQNNKDVQVRVTGEELDVKFISSSVVCIEQSLKTIAEIELLKKKLIIPFSAVSPPSSSTVSSDSYIPLDVTSINCHMNFAGSTVRMYKLENFGSASDSLLPSFDLRTPAVTIAVEYTKTTGINNHHINFEITTSSSYNTVYSSCVPVLYDMYDSLKHLNQKDRKQSEPKGDTVKSSDIMNLLSKLNIDFVMHIDEQRLTMSCEPSAKVQAVVGINSIDIRLSTNELTDANPFTGIIAIRQMTASLQHSFSREVSGSIGVDEILLTSFIKMSSSCMVLGACKVRKIDGYVNLKQLQDLDLFGDLWFPGKFNASTSPKNDSLMLSKLDKDDNIVLKFQRASTTTLIMWNLDFMITDVNFQVDLGQSLGSLSLKLDKSWGVSKKKSDREQTVLLGLETLVFLFEGRLSGHITIKNTRLHSVIKWSLVGDEYEIPLVLLSFGFDSIECKTSFDYNVFSVGRILNSNITVFNQIDPNQKLLDRLISSTSFESVELYITSLAASNVLDIYNTLSRIRQDNKRSYNENLKTALGDENKKKANDIIDMIATLRTEIDVSLGRLLLHVYPNSLLDSQVLVINIGGLSAHFEQELVSKKVFIDLKLIIKDINVALSSNKNILAEHSLNSSEVNEFINHALNAKGGTIFTFPSLECWMKTWSSPDSNVIEYLYKSSFGGKVDVRWNLGSINFIKEMWMIHARALSSRLPEARPGGEVALFGDENIEEKIKDVDLGDKYVYSPIEPPIIEAPQLKDLGDATPPLEWFGLHRQRFPGFTHRVVIVGLQKLVGEVELQYGRILGKA